MVLAALDSFIGFRAAAQGTPGGGMGGAREGMCHSTNTQYDITVGARGVGEGLKVPLFLGT